MSCKNDVDDDNAGAAETGDVTIAVNNDAATAVIKNQKQCNKPNAQNETHKQNKNATTQTPNTKQTVCDTTSE